MVLVMVGLASCAVEAQFGKVEEYHLSGCNTDRAKSPARVVESPADTDVNDYVLQHGAYVQVKSLGGSDYYIVAQYRVNCCPQSVDAHLRLSKDGELIIHFEEFRGIHLCDCTCPLRCEATLSEMSPGMYPVKVYYNGLRRGQFTITLAPGVDDIIMLDR